MEEVKMDVKELLSGVVRRKVISWNGNVGRTKDNQLVILTPENSLCVLGETREVVNYGEVRPGFRHLIQRPDEPLLMRYFNLLNEMVYRDRMISLLDDEDDGVCSDEDDNIFLMDVAEKVFSNTNTVTLRDVCPFISVAHMYSKSIADTYEDQLYKFGCLEDELKFFLSRTEPGLEFIFSKILDIDVNTISTVEFSFPEGFLGIGPKRFVMEADAGKLHVYPSIYERISIMNLRGEQTKVVVSARGKECFSEPLEIVNIPSDLHGVLIANVFPNESW
jgi:hypothetical protein